MGLTLLIMKRLYIYTYTWVRHGSQVILMLTIPLLHGVF